MIGEDYFELRSSIGTELLALAAAVRDNAGDPESLTIIDNLVASLKEPFVFVVVGEVNVGKSTFLNALFGQEFSRTGVMPTTEKILFFKHGHEHRVVPVTPTLDEVHVPADFLRDFHIVDTPGTNSIENEHQQITERFVPVADLVIFVFPAMNPWGASAWQFLDKVHREWMRNVVFILQQCDLRSPEEIQVITDYMGQLCRQRFGREFPLFAVSAKKAFLARSSGIDRERLLEESGFQKLEAHISTAVQQHPARMKKLAGTLALGRQILEQLRERTVAGMRTVQRKTTLLAELMTERDMQADRTLKKILPALDATERDYHESVMRVAGLANDALATRKAFQRDPSPEDEPQRPQSLDHRLLQELHHRTGDRWRQTGLILDEDCRQFDRFMRAQGRNVLFMAETPSREAENDSESEIRRRFATRVDSALRRFVIALRLDEDIEPGLLRARKTARWMPRLVPAVIVLASLAGWLGGPLQAAIIVGAGLMLLGVIFLLTQMRLASARNAILDKLEESSATLREMLATQAREEVEHAFARFLDVLTPAQTDAMQREQDSGLHVERLRRLTESFDALEARIASAKSAAS
ncbi:MAG: dynamin family protein [Verrucomicrobiaceae bacterium]|nr:dynamin family protein [Verrucomicrobiaceae bacterium]